MRTQWLVVLLGLVSCQALPAQETRGSIQGRVTDTSGAVIPGTAVHATNKATNVTVSTRSNAEGNYSIPYLVSGIYVLKAEVGGFKTFIRDNIEIRIDDRLNIPIQLEIGELTEALTVTAETPLLESTNASMGQVIDQRRIAELPIAHGNPYLLMQLSAGVVYTQNAGLDLAVAGQHLPEQVGSGLGGAMYPSLQHWHFRTAGNNDRSGPLSPAISSTEWACTDCRAQ